MAAELNAKIEALTNYWEALDLMEDEKLDTTDVTKFEEAKKRLRIHAGTLTGGRKSSPDEEVIARIRQEDRELRDELLTMYKRVRLFLSNLPDSNMADVRKAFPDLDDILDQGEKSLEEEKCAILVAGETSAGKSTLLNLLLGQIKHNLLPTHELSTTSVICELKYAESPHAVAHPWPGDNAMAIYIPLTGTNAADTLKNCIFQASDRGSKKFPYERVEIFWPSPWLKAGVTIVDSPGIGESELMTSLVMDYMPKSFGFIYVINSDNAGGIQEDRLQDMLLRYTTSDDQTKMKEEGWQLDPRSAIFVANKWEMVKQKERQEVKDKIFEQLHNIWTGLSESQVFFLSAKEALGSMEGGVVNEDFGKLLDGLQTLLPVGLKQRIAKHFSSLSMVMQNATRIMRTYLTQLEVSDMEREATCEEATKRLRQIEKRPKEIKHSLDNLLAQEITEGVKKANKHLGKPEVKARLCHWEDGECPNSDKLDLLDDLMFAYSLKRIRGEINKWDKENKIFEGIQDRFLEAIKEKFLSLEAELGKIERQIATGEKELPNKAHFFGRQATVEEELKLTKKEKVFLGVTAPIWVPLGLVVGLFALPVYGVKALFRNRKDRQKLDAYREDKASAMARATNYLLGQIMDSNGLKKLLQEKIEMTTAMGEKIMSRIPDLIEADKQIVQNLKQKRQDDDQLLQLLYPLQNEALQLQGEMDLMYMTKIRPYDMTVDDLIGWQETDRPVAQGAFAKIFKAKVNTQGEYGTTPCAIKMLTDPNTREVCPLTSSNASDAWLEEANLRKLQHQHVVKYYGTALKSNGPLHYLLMVMEFCSCSLDTYIDCRDPYTPPGECIDDDKKWMTSLVHSTDLAWQITDGILGIHSLGFVHRDLKPANILMTDDRHIRLADLGLSKSENKVSGTLAGTPLYMGPEIITKGRYDRTADMFALGHILWELWYGTDISSVYQLDKLALLPKKAFMGKQRQPKVESPWRQIMLGCWSEDPKKRPDAATCCKMFADYKVNLGKSKGAEK